MTTANGAANAEKAYLAYLNAYREFIESVAEFAQRGWPDLKPELQNAFMSQRLILSREALRVRYLTIVAPTELSALRSVSQISARVTECWSANEEGSLAAQNAEYRDLQTEIDRRVSLTKIAPIEGPILAVERDPDYREAGRRLHDETVRIDKSYFGEKK